MTKAKIRITGLVRAANWAREALSTGIAAQDVPAFRKRVNATLTQVEAICKEHHVQPQDLPTPSYRAYCFLKEIPLDALPVAKGKAPEKRQTVHITNVVAVQNDMNAAFFEWVMDPKHKTEALDARHSKVLEFTLEILRHTLEIERLAKEQGGTPGHLPTRSLRAYQWLKFLSDPPTLVTHLETLRAVMHEFHQPRCPTRLTPRPALPAEVEFTYGTHLYRAVRAETGLKVSLHEGLINAPPEVVRAVVCMVVQKKSPDYQNLIRDYGLSDDFLEVVTALELTTTSIEDFTRGQTYDLEKVFHRVNTTYFGGKMARPKLMWNRVLTTSRMGHYDLFRDVVMVSITLDAPDVPEYVVDYVMYHELLHKQMGVTINNGRRNVHPPEFRAAERRFQQYAQARAFINSKPHR